MGDIGERPAVDEGRIALQRLHEVRLEGLLQEHGHRTVGLQVGRGHGLAVPGIGDDDPPQPLAQFRERLAEAETGHDLGGHGDVETAFPGHGIVHPAQAEDDVPQRTVVHVDDPLPDDPPQVDPQGVAVVDVVVQHRGQEIVGQLDGVEIAGEMEVDVLHGDDLGVAAAGSAALHAEARTQRRLAEADAGLFADAVQAVAEADAGSRLALAGGRGRDGGHQDELAGRPVLQPMIEFQGDLGFVSAVVLQVVGADAEPLGDVLDRPDGRAAGDFDIGRKATGNVGHDDPLVITAPKGCAMTAQGAAQGHTFAYL